MKRDDCPFGWCVECGDEIEDARLHSSPEFTFPVRDTGNTVRTRMTALIYTDGTTDGPGMDIDMLEGQGDVLPADLAAIGHWLINVADEL